MAVAAEGRSGVRGESPQSRVAAAAEPDPEESAGPGGTAGGPQPTLRALPAPAPPRGFGFHSEQGGGLPPGPGRSRAGGPPLGAPPSALNLRMLTQSRC